MVQPGLIRRDILQMIHEAGSGHPGGSLSLVEILCHLYWNEMRIRPREPHWDQRDRLVLSKGHAAPALYAVLARRGYFDVERLRELRKFGSGLEGHPHMQSLPGLDCSTGSLGQGLGIAAGMALGLELRKPAPVFSAYWATASCRREVSGNPLCPPGPTGRITSRPLLTGTVCSSTARWRR